MPESWMGRCSVCESEDVYAVHSAGGLEVRCHACDERTAETVEEAPQEEIPPPVVPERTRTGREREFRVTYRRSPRYPEELWANVLDTPEGARRSALGLLESLREGGCKRPAVLVDGRRVRG